MADIQISKKNEVYAYVDCDHGIANELSEYFSFFAKDYKWNPKFKTRRWDGKIRLFDKRDNTIYAGLYAHLEQFAAEREYTITITGFTQNELTVDTFKKFYKSLNIPAKFRLVEHQVRAVWSAIEQTRGLYLSPTSSGKSLMIYETIRWFNEKTLIIVPTVTLIDQLEENFSEFGWTEPVHKLYSAQNPNTDHSITISTWNSAIKQSNEWLQQFGCVIVDEAHLANAKSIKSILERMPETKYRFGYTGSTDGTDTHRLVLEGLFGPCRSFIRTKELMDLGIVAKLDIQCVVLKHTEERRRLVSKMTYAEEMTYITGFEKRNLFICDLCLNLNGNTLLLFQYVEKHGKILHELLKNSKKKVYFVYGGVGGDERTQIRQIVEKENDCIIIASYGTFSTGVSIKNIHNVVFATAYKSRIKNVQSIGRGLRVSDTKKSVKLFDIVDDFSWKKVKNYTLEHFISRLQIYSEEKFDYTFKYVEFR